MAEVMVPGQRAKGDPPKAETLEDWGSLNTKAQRPAIKPNEFSWVENFMPIGPGNLRTLYGEATAKYTAGVGRTIILHFPYNLGSTSYVAVFLDDGSAVQVRKSDGATTTIGGAGKFYNGGDLPACRQYQSKYLLIGGTVSSNGYWVWDGTSLFGAGTLAPQITLLSSGSGYGSNPTVTLFTNGSGTGTTFSATETGGFVTGVTVTNPGSGFALGDHVQLIFSGGGSDTQARAHATVDSSKGGVTEVNITAGGSAYTNDVHVTFTGGGGSGAAAVVSTATNGVIVGVTVTNPGTGYTSAPVVAFVATGGSGATAVANVTRGQITAITLDAGGSGYTGAPQVVITAPDDTSFPTVQAVATALVSGGAVTGFSITNNGAGYINAGIDLQGGNNAAYATATLMPFGLKANTIETYNNQVWTAQGTTETFSAPNSVSQFSTSSGGGSAPATDSFLRERIVALIQNSGYLYRFGDSSINSISNVQTSTSAVTTFSNQNVDAQVGTAWRDSVVAFGRAIVFANPNGVYALFGGSAEKVSDALDGLFAKASFNTGQNGVTPTAAVATIFGIRVYMLLFTTTDPYTNTLRNILAMWDGQKWFVGSQVATLKFVSPEEIDSLLNAWGTDGTHLYLLFQTATASLTKVFQTKLNARSGVHFFQQVNRGYLVVENNSATAATFNISVDTEKGNGAPVAVTASQTLTFVGAGGVPIQFTGLGGANLNFTVGGLQITGFPLNGYGLMTGWTATTTALDSTVLSIGSIERPEYALNG
jgi:hypothetical protein